MLDKKKAIINFLVENGYSLNSANYYGNKIFSEWFGESKIKYSDNERQWAYERGFLAEVARMLNLNENNFSNFINSEDYYILDPIDPITKRLVDGKLTIHYSIGGKYPQYMPRYYAWINEFGKVIHLDDEIENESISLEDYLSILLEKVHCVAIKPLAGAGGIGFLKLEKRNSEYFANNERITKINEIIPLINDKYVVTEYIQQCKDFSNIWDKSAATLRVITINGTVPKSFVTYVRFGTEISKGACNLTSGGVGAPFNWDTGEFLGNYYRYINFCKDGKFLLDKHPDSGVSLKGKTLPYFDEVKQLVNDLSHYLSVHKYFGWDIIISDDGPKICEINSHPSLDYEQLMFGGIWARNDEVSSFFNKLLQNKKKNKNIVLDFINTLL